MSLPPDTPPNHIHVTAITVCLDQAERSKRLRSGKLHIGPHRHKLTCNNGTLCQKFINVAELTPSTRITLRYKASLLSLPKKIQIDTVNLFAGVPASQAQGFKLSISHNGIRVEFSCQNANTVHTNPENPEDETHTTHTDQTLTPTTNAIFEGRPQFRILVIGKSGVGKSSLIHSAFGIDTAHSSDFVRGEANIETGLESEANKRFILHDSLGFEAADNVNYDTVKEFIRRRRACEPKDRLHAIWFCVPVPQAGSRLLEAAAEDFFKAKEETIGTIPIIVVYTKADKFLNDWLLKSAASHQQHDDDHLTDLAFSEVTSHVKGKHEGINQFAGESLPYAVVSTKEKYKYTLQKLVKLTSNQVGARDTPEAQIPPGTTLIAAQRVDPNLKIKGTIDVGRQKYWKALRASPVFPGNTIWDCLSVIHADIVAIWNFNDPACHLSDKNFKELVAKMAVKVGTCSVPTHTQEILVSIRSSLMVGILNALRTLSSPVALITLPSAEDLAPAMRSYGIYYQSEKNIQQLFIAYIVDLTHILETLAILTARDHKKLTRRTIKLAYHSYHCSDMMTQAHGNIQKYRELDGPDAALKMIEDSIDPERYGDASLRNYYAEIGKLDLEKFHLDQEEEW